MLCSWYVWHPDMYYSDCDTLVTENSTIVHGAISMADLQQYTIKKDRLKWHNMLCWHIVHKFCTVHIIIYHFNIGLLI